MVYASAPCCGRWWRRRAAACRRPAPGRSRPPPPAAAAPPPPASRGCTPRAAETILRTQYNPLSITYYTCNAHRIQLCFGRQHWQVTRLGCHSACVLRQMPVAYKNPEVWIFVFNLDLIIMMVNVKTPLKSIVGEFYFLICCHNLTMYSYLKYKKIITLYHVQYLFLSSGCQMTILQVNSKK